MREKAWYPVLYMFLITAFFSSVLIGFSRFTRDRVDANQRLAFEKAILMALPLELPAGTSSQDMHELFLNSVSKPSPSSAGAWVLLKQGKVAAYALPFDGQGFWDRLKGVIGISADKKTLTGIAFYEQKETPGLGAEIVRPKFRDQFRDKRMAEGPDPIIFKPEGSALGAGSVHAVTGATQTSTRLEKILNDQLIHWRSAMQTHGEG